MDDERAILSSISRVLEGEPYELITSNDPMEVLDLVRHRDISLIIADQRMPGMTGVELLEAVRSCSPRTGRVILTGYGVIDVMSDALAGGRIERVLHKPWDGEQLRDQVRELLERQEAAPAEEPTAVEMAGRSRAVEEIRRVIGRVAPRDSMVLITGETGTGKELVAQAIHAEGPRVREPFVGINCGAIAETLLASELFGHMRGAFTGADADKRGLFEVAGEGTVFLDEVGEVPPALQAKLLRALETREMFPVGSTHPVRIRARILAATNLDLEEMMRQGRFRPDLYYRLSVLEIRVPPLRERPGDISAIVEQLTARLCRKLRRAAVELEPDVLRAFAQYAWPGNVRELANVLERILILSDGSRVTLDDLPRAITHARTVDPDNLRIAREIFDRSHIARVIDRYNGDKRAAAKVLGISLSSLYRRLGQNGSIQAAPPGAQE